LTGGVGRDVAAVDQRDGTDRDPAVRDGVLLGVRGAATRKEMRVPNASFPGLGINTMSRPNAVSVRHRSPNLARDELPQDVARAEPELTDLATRHGSRCQQVIHLPDFFVAFLLRQFVEPAEKLGGDSHDAEECVTLSLFGLHSLFCLHLILVETTKQKSKNVAVRMGGGFAPSKRT